MKCKIADFNFNINNLNEYIIKQIKNYESNNDEIDYCFENTQEDIENERKLSVGKFGDGYIESIATYRKIAEWIPLHNSFLLHSACFDVDGVGVAFAAHSGTGKTTHMRLWQEYLGDRMTVVNGDKPIVRFLNNAECGINPSASFLGTSPQRGGGNEFPNSKQPPLKGEGDMNCHIENSLPSKGDGDMWNAELTPPPRSSAPPLKGEVEMNSRTANNLPLKVRGK